MTASRRFMYVAWPAFLLACALNFLVFGLVDPADVHWNNGPTGLSRTAIYTIGFFLFWLMAMAAGALTLLLAQPASPSSEINYTSER